MCVAICSGIASQDVTLQLHNWKYKNVFEISGTLCSIVPLVIPKAGQSLLLLDDVIIVGLDNFHFLSWHLVVLALFKGKQF